MGKNTRMTEGPSDALQGEEGTDAKKTPLTLMDRVLQRMVDKFDRAVLSNPGPIATGRLGVHVEERNER